MTDPAEHPRYSISVAARAGSTIPSKGGATLVTVGGVVSASAVTVTVVFAVAEPEAFVAVNV